MPDGEPSWSEKDALPPTAVLLGLLFNSAIIAVVTFAGNVGGLMLTGETLPMRSLVIASVFVAVLKGALYLARKRGINGV